MENKIKTLTATENKVARLISMGLSNKEISEKLFITLATLKGHICKIYSKLGITSTGLEKSTMRVRLALDFITNNRICEKCPYKKLINIINNTKLEEFENVGN